MTPNSNIKQSMLGTLLMAIALLSLGLWGCAEKKKFAGSSSQAASSDTLGDGDGDALGGSDGDAVGDGDEPLSSSNEDPGGSSNGGNGGPNIGGPADPEACNEADDKLDFQYTDKDVQACNDSGKIWDFYKNECSQAGQSTSFTCDFETIIKQIGDFGINPTDKLTRGAAGDSKDGKVIKLVACGEANNGKTIIAQWVELPEGKVCQPNQAEFVTTGCYAKSDANIDPNMDTDTLLKWTSSCLNNSN